MMGHREPMKGGDEVDAFSPWKHVHIWRSTDRHRIKTRHSRRIRHVAKQSLSVTLREVDDS